MAELEDCNLHKGNLSKANFHNAILMNVDLSWANFYSANLVGTVFENCNLDNANLKNAKYNKSTIFPDSFKIPDTMILVNDDGHLTMQDDNILSKSRGMFRLNLTKGLNMIALPVQLDSPMTAKTLSKEIGATLVIRLDLKTKAFVPFVPEHFEGTNFEIDGGMGVIINVLEDKEITFTGTVWNNVDNTAPAINTNPVWSFTIIFDGQDLDVASLSVNNLTRGIDYLTQIDENSKIGLASSLDSSQQAVIESGDLIQVTIDGKRWRYQVTSEDLENAFAHFTLNTDLRIPNQHQLLQNYPNPFNPETWIPFKLAQDSTVTAKIYDVTGKKIRMIELGHLSAGNYVESNRAIYWDGKTEDGEQVSSGTYFYQIEAGDYTETRKMVILK